MGKYAQLVMGPAGSGKSTYCKTIQEHCQNQRRTVHVVNLDPAAEQFNYPVSIDIRELVTVEEAMTTLSLGPNGGLVYCMEQLLEDIDWFKEQIDEYEEDYLIIDCPGQIELFTHYPVMSTFARHLKNWGYNVVAVYLLDSHFITDAAKFMSGVLMCLSVMYQMELPHINVLTKMDLIWSEQNGNLSNKFKRKHPFEGNKADLERFLDPDIPRLIDDLNEDMDVKYKDLNTSLGRLLEDDPLVGFLSLNIKDEDSVELVLSHVDNAIQYGEDLEPKEPKDEFADEDNNNDD